ncbi:ubiquitin carboxyl-terminal hydrolase 35-like [Polypterus senegalus]|uniref:ubiquitin carboxyl-terminal hydrolase 35-like n=1 Tax=Polypterus senegalus TaxID=55291 RepID=UPI001965D1D8|nr:ubiquitin carboxyl-terminal hydrolase 35-like [Polypterus senegalus]
MDRILEAVMVSSHSKAVKHNMILQVIESAPHPLARTQCLAMFEVCTKLFFLGDSKFKKDVGKEVLEAYAHHHPLEFEEFFNTRFALDLLQEGYGPIMKRSDEIFEYIQVALQYMVDRPSSMELFHTLQIEVLRIICERPGPKLCAMLSKLLNLYPQCIPGGNLQSVFCQQLIQSIRKFHCEGEENDEILEFVEQVTKTSGMLQCVWRMNMAIILPSLKELFIVISSPEEENNAPSNALASVVQYVPLELMDAVVRNITNDKNVSDAQILTAISRMLDWLSWPLVKNIDKWIISLMKGVVAVKRVHILMKVTLKKTEQVFSNLFYPIVREGALSVLSYILLSYEQSPEAFHKLLHQIPQLISSLSQEDSDSGRACLAEISELIHCLIFRFSGFPDLYEPVLEALKDFPSPHENRIKQLLSQNTWTSVQTELPEPVCYTQITTRSDTGKTGLVNLGNTCYMNSIIQALYMASDFRYAVMTLKQCSRFPLMMKLQQLFGFLEHSQRPFISPNKFLTASCPPWFNVGSQQDCSEYLKYLLDKLHEEEKTLRHASFTQSGVQKSESKTLIEQMFGGKMVTRIRCLCCQNVSWKEEVFTDLSLALPPHDISLSKSFIIDPSQTVVENTEPLHVASTLKQQSQVPSSPRRIRKTLTDTTSKHESPTFGNIDGVHLKTTDKSAKMDSSSPGSSQEQPSLPHSLRSIPDLINFFLSPEMLTGENQYHCQKCCALTDAEKVVELTEGPPYLILTLLRFSFDLGTMRRRKILDNVSIPLVLKLPVWDVSSREPGTFGTDNKHHKAIPPADGCAYVSLTYDLCSVVVHSGISSESGHYYCYARECTGGVGGPEAIHSDREEVKAPSSQKSAERQWFLFNDTRVSYSSFESVSNVTTYFPKDTAYVMFFRKRLLPVIENESFSTAEKMYGEMALNKELSESISKDNLLYAQEREREERRRAALSATETGPPVWLKRHKRSGADCGCLSSGCRWHLSHFFL